MNEDYPSIISSLVSERDELKKHLERLQKCLDNIGFPPGHFYSPLVDVTDPHAIRAVRDRQAAEPPRGIRLDAAGMKAQLERLAAHDVRFPFPRQGDERYRYYFENPFFACHDGSILFSVLLEFKPRRIIEVGSGFSSSLMLDTNDQFFAGGINLTFIDPQLDTLVSQFEPQGPGTATLLRRRVQDIPIESFDQLEANDILFIDSSHVSKTGSDVNYYLFEIMPRLKPGVLIHIHDILYPFEYLEEWIIGDKRSWNEAYIVKAFLQYNESFEILYWNNFVFHRLTNDLARLMPRCMENEGGSLWLRRVR